MQLRSSGILFTTEKQVVEEEGAVWVAEFMQPNWKLGTRLFLIIDLETCSHSEPLGNTPLEYVQSKHIKNSIEEKEPRDSMFSVIISYQG